MRILVVSKFMHHVGGVETYIDWLATQLPSVGAQLMFFGMTPPDGSKIMPSVQSRVVLTPNRDYASESSFHKFRSAASSVYSREVYNKLRKVMDNFQPDLIHFHGTCYQLTPSVAVAAQQYNIPSVLTVHEYKLVCANQRLWNDKIGAPCFACAGDTSSLSRSRQILAKQCVKGSFAASSIASVEQPLSERAWRRLSPVVHAPSRYIGSLLGQSGYNSERISYLDLPWHNQDNLSSAQGSPSSTFRVGFLGRLAPEKGVSHLLEAWPRVQRESRVNTSLTIFGGGGEVDSLRQLAKSLKIDLSCFAGTYNRSDLTSILGSLDVTVHPSVWAENSPYSVRESLMHGVPAIVSDRGGLPEMVSPETGSVLSELSPEAISDAILAEQSAMRRGTSSLKRAAASRAITDAEHLLGLTSIYEKACS